MHYHQHTVAKKMKRRSTQDLADFSWCKLTNRRNHLPSMFIWTLYLDWLLKTVLRVHVGSSVEILLYIFSSIRSKVGLLQSTTNPLSKAFVCNCDVWQGHNLSPILFGLSLNDHDAFLTAISCLCCKETQYLGHYSPGPVCRLPAYALLPAACHTLPASFPLSTSHSPTCQSPEISQQLKPKNTRLFAYS